ncbi:MAG: DUF4368 domain-containing protein [Clostridiales bacterium]|nr:DUF4368 domain-containing protein [Clostridiales bacterium]
MLKPVPLDEERARENFLRAREKSGSTEENRLKAYKNRLAELNKLIQAAFEERTLKNMPESVYAELCEKYKKERCAVEEEIIKLEQRLATAGGQKGEEEYIQKLKQYGRCETLTRELCLQLIELITVGEKNSNGEREIHIYYRVARD